jgi:hypothetical protein
VPVRAGVCVRRRRQEWQVSEPVMCDGTFQIAKVRFALGPNQGRRVNGKCGICGQSVKAIVMTRHEDGAVDTARICWHEIAGVAA